MPRTTPMPNGERARDRSALATLPDPDLAAYAEATVTFAAEAWPMKAAEELRSALVYRALADAARRARFGFGAVAELRRAMYEELRHARVCAVVGRRFGARRPTYDARPVARRLAALPHARGRAVALALVEVAIGETISTALFRAARRGSHEPLTRAALSMIVIDEVSHQRLGWVVVGAWWPELDAREREALQDEARRGLASFEQTIAFPALRRLAAGAPFDPAAASLGVIEPSARVEAFYEALERHVLPRLDRLGLDGRAAWAQRYRA